MISSSFQKVKPNSCNSPHSKIDSFTFKASKIPGAADSFMFSFLTNLKSSPMLFFHEIHEKGVLRILNFFLYDNTNTIK